MNKEQTLTGVIRGTGACVPKRVMDNDEIAGFVETSDEWIRERTRCGTASYSRRGNNCFHGC